MHCTIILIGEQLTAIGLGGSGCVSATKYLLTSSKGEYEWVGGSEEGSAKDNAMQCMNMGDGKKCKTCSRKKGYSKLLL